MFCKKVVQNHFNAIASSYDYNNQKLYWKLCDDLLWRLIEDNLALSNNLHF